MKNKNNKNMIFFKVLIFWSCLLPFYGESATLEEKIEKIRESCKPRSAVTVKKILISVKKDSNFINGGGCSEQLSFLLKSCTKKMGCKELHRLTQDFLSGESSNVIGE